jgi:hypothetical protein
MRKRILSLILLIFLASPIFGRVFGVPSPPPEELILDGISINIEFPSFEVVAGKDFDIKLTIIPSLTEYTYPPGKVYIESFNVYFAPSYKETLLYQQTLSEAFTKTFRLKATFDMNHVPYPIIIKVSYVINKGTSQEKSYQEEFRLDLPLVVDKTREELENDYESLIWNYTSLKNDYNSLEHELENQKSNFETLSKDYNYLSKEYQDLNVTTIYLSIVTIVFLALTLYLGWKVIRIRKEQSKSNEQKGEGLVKR